MTGQEREILAGCEEEAPKSKGPSQRHQSTGRYRHEQGGGH